MLEDGRGEMGDIGGGASPEEEVRDRRVFMPESGSVLVTSV